MLSRENNIVLGGGVGTTFSAGGRENSSAAQESLYFGSGMHCPSHTDDKKILLFPTIENSKQIVSKTVAPI